MGELDLCRRVTCNSSQDDATVKCWGDNLWGQLGYGDTSARGDESDGDVSSATHPRLWRLR